MHRFIRELTAILGYNLIRETAEAYGSCDGHKTKPRFTQCNH